MRRLCIILLAACIFVGTTQVWADEKLFITFAAQYQTASDCRDIIKVGDYIFACESDAGVGVYRLSAETMPEFQYRILDCGYAGAIAYCNGTLYVIGKSGISTYNAANPQAVVKIRMYNFTGSRASEYNVFDIEADGGYVYATAGLLYGVASEGLMIFQETTLKLLYKGTEFGAAEYLAVDGNRLYIETGCLFYNNSNAYNPLPGSLVVLDITDRKNPRRLCYYQISFEQGYGDNPTNLLYAQLKGIAISGNYVYAAVGDGRLTTGSNAPANNGVWRFDVSGAEGGGISAVRLDLSFAFSGKRVADVKVQGDILYVVSRDSKKIILYDIRNGKADYLSSASFTTTGNYVSSYIADGYYFAADYATGWHAYKITAGDYINTFLSDEYGRPVDGGNNVIYGSVSYTNVGGGLSDKSVLILAVYDEGDILRDITIKKDINITAGTINRIDKLLSVQNTDIGNTIKFFWLDSLYNLTPLGKTTIKNNIKMDRPYTNRIYVDGENGSDYNPGTMQLPLKTLTEAKNTVKRFKKHMNEDIYVVIRGGTYYFDETLLFTEADSGENGFNVVYCAADNETVILSGAKKITGWKLHDTTKNIYVADAKGIKSRQFFVNGERAVRAKSNAKLNKVTADDGEYGIATSDLFIADYQYPQDLELVFEEVWTNPRVSVKSVRISNNRLFMELNQPFWSRMRDGSQTSVFAPVKYENAYELLDEEGEYYLNTHENLIYYKPRANENMADAICELPALESVIDVCGLSELERASNIRFEGLIFECSGWYTPSEFGGYADRQNNSAKIAVTPNDRIRLGIDELCSGAVNINYSKDITISDCVFRKIGNIGVRSIEAVKNCSIINNEFYDISAQAIALGSLDITRYANPENKEAVITNVCVEDNYIHDVAVEYKGSAAVSAGFISDSRFSHNEIANVPYSGLHIGWGWGIVESSIMNNLNITNNYIHGIMRDLRDGGAIYILGGSNSTDPSQNQITGNYIKDQYSSSAPLYADAGASYNLFSNNVVDTKDSWNERFAISNPGSKNNSFIGNYVTNPIYYVSANSQGIIIQDNYCYPEADWPQAALDIINNAGIRRQKFRMD